jgi:hypothetical protein
VEAPMTDWLREAYENNEVLATARGKKRVSRSIAKQPQRTGTAKKRTHPGRRLRKRSR